MKFTGVSLSLIAASALAAPTPTINKYEVAKVAKRASVTDTPVGYASQNGGTTGGAGGTITTVSAVRILLQISSEKY